MTSTMPYVAIVDDDPSVLKALARQLRALGMEVRTFESGPDFLDALDETRPDCLLLDIHMRGIGGFEVQHRMEQRGIRVPTVIITAHDDPYVRDRANAIGARFLSKPFSSQSLLESIATACAG